MRARVQGRTNELDHCLYSKACTKLGLAKEDHRPQSHGTNYFRERMKRNIDQCTIDPDRALKTTTATTKTHLRGMWNGNSAVECPGTGNVNGTSDQQMDGTVSLAAGAANE